MEIKKIDGKKEISSYMSKVLQKSMLTSIPHIASAGNRPKAVLRSLIFLLCTTGFIYQSISFMQLYWKYSTTVNVEVFTPSKDQRPAMTFCTENGIVMSKLCEDTNAAKYNLKCIPRSESEIENWCQRYRVYCYQKKVLSDLSLKDISRITYLPWKVKKTWMTGIWDFLICVEEGMAPGKFTIPCIKRNMTFLEIGCPNQNNLPEYCVTVNTLIGRPDDKFEKVLTDGRLIIDLNHRTEESPKYLNEKLVYASFHNPYQVLNPIYEGYKLQGDATYKILLKKVVKKLLPYPYDTYCFDYLKQWKARGGRGPVTQKDCMHECRKNLSLARHGCVLNSLHAPGKEPRCPNHVIDNTLNKDSEECSKKNCKVACHDEYYLVHMEMAVKFENIKPRCKVQSGETSRSTLFIYMNGMETTLYTYNPKYENIETFSYLGGYVGIWLGISLMAVFDFMDTLMLLLKYPYSRYFLNKKKMHLKDMTKPTKLV